MKTRTELLLEIQEKYKEYFKDGNINNHVKQSVFPIVENGDFQFKKYIDATLPAHIQGEIEGVLKDYK